MANIKIFVTYKDRHRIIQSDAIIPIQTGRAIADEIFEDMIGDDTGDNISNKNEDYCELSAMYWAWKNYEKIGNPTHVGFMHYRRLLNFSGNDNIKFFEQYEKNLSKEIEKFSDYDVILPVKLPAYSPTLKRNAKNLREQWEAEYNIEELEAILNYIIEKHPQMQNAINTVMTSEKSYWYNIFTMKKYIFDEYCSWLFEILKHSENVMKWERAQGFLAERLFNIFIEYKKTQSNIKYIESPIFRPLEVQYNNQKIKDIVPIVLISSDEYVPQTSTTICSIIQNAKNKEELQFFILSDGITSKNKNIILKFVNKQMAKINFIDVNEKMLDKFKNSKVPSHIKTTTFIKLLIPEILSQYDKILYIDSDMMVRKDIKELLSIELNNNLLGLCEDVANTIHSKRLFNKDNYNYYNAGLILYNAKCLREMDYLPQVLNALSKNHEKYILADQDLINDVYGEKIQTLNTKWNNHYKWHDKFQFFCPKDIQEYKKNEDNPAIVHYCGLSKIWYNVEARPFKHEYFTYWKKTPFYRFFRINKYKDYHYQIYRINIGEFIFFEKKENTEKTIFKLCSLKFKYKNNKNYFFHKEYNNGRNILNILGVKIKFFNKSSVHRYVNELLSCNNVTLSKNRHDLIYHWKSRFFSIYQKDNFIKSISLDEAFIKCIDPTELVKTLRNYFGYADISKFYHTEILIYINLLIKANDKSNAKKELIKYISIFGYQDIYRFFEVANLAVEVGVTDEKVLKTVQLYKHMIKNRQKVKDIVQSKTIALVGNGPYELGKRRGKEIDAHDIVIRINNYKIDGFEDDYGTKTDVWARGMGGSDVIDKTKNNEYKAVLYANDFSQFPIMFNLFDVIDEANERGVLHTFIESDVFNKTREKSKIFFPTTGFNTIMFLLKSCNIKSLDCYGFQFLEDNFNKEATHYFNDRDNNETIRRSACHSLDEEAKFLKQLLYKDNTSTII